MNQRGQQASVADLANPAHRAGRPQQSRQKEIAAELKAELARLKTNAIEGSEPDVLPTAWNGPHVQLRMVQAFETLRKQPAVLGPREFGTIWPGYEDEYAQQKAAAESWWAGLADTEEERKAKAGMEWSGVLRLIREEAEQAQLRADKPTVQEITRMETVIGWPGRYLNHRYHHWRIALLRVAHAKAVGKDCDWLEKKHGIAADVWQSRAWAGSDLIAGGLKVDRVAVF